MPLAGILLEARWDPPRSSREACPLRTLPNANLHRRNPACNGRPPLLSTLRASHHLHPLDTCPNPPQLEVVFRFFLISSQGCKLEKPASTLSHPELTKLAKLESDQPTEIGAARGVPGAVASRAWARRGDSARVFEVIDPHIPYQVGPNLRPRERLSEAAIR